MVDHFVLFRLVVDVGGHEPVGLSDVEGELGDVLRLGVW